MHLGLIIQSIGSSVATSSDAQRLIKFHAIAKLKRETEFLHSQAIRIDSCDANGVVLCIDDSCHLWNIMDSDCQCHEHANVCKGRESNLQNGR